MTKEEAIKYLQQLYPNGGHCWLDEQRIEAIGMAVKALQDEAQKAVEIAREEIYKWLQEHSQEYVYWMDEEFGKDDLINDLKQAMKDE